MTMCIDLSLNLSMGCRPFLHPTKVAWFECEKEGRRRELTTFQTASGVQHGKHFRSVGNLGVEGAGRSNGKDGNNVNVATSVQLVRICFQAGRPVYATSGSFVADKVQPAVLYPLRSAFLAANVYSVICFFCGKIW